MLTSVKQVAGAEQSSMGDRLTGALTIGGEGRASPNPRVLRRMLCGHL
ncbi:hypothetical protein [Mycobacterium colombiense]|nr:hypothetical protein [Mycobacterium colombiense]